MCGIAAIFGNGGKEFFASILEMIRLVAHRGPDDAGLVFFSPAPLVYGCEDTPFSVFNSPHSYAPRTFFNGSPPDYTIAVLGHRRLSILDLSATGHQPLCSDCQRFWITYNGEVYNYIEIRNELKERGYHFLSNSDTEVILKAYQEWGADCLHRFNGMFAFVIYDQKEKKFFAARDRFGVKPLYFKLGSNGCIAFASEIKQFTALSDWSPQLDGQLAYDFLNWGVQDHTDGTLFFGVKQLRGGEYIEASMEDLSHRQLQIKQWYTLNTTPFCGSFEEAVIEFRYLLEDSIKLRLRADVPVGSCLSGGLDSSSIVCLMHRQLKEQNSADKLHTFSACSHQARFDERPFIDTIVNAMPIEAHYTYPNLDKLFEECEQMIWHQDEPFPSTSIYAQWLVFKLVKENKVKVILDGQGADEQLGGYHGFFGNHFYDLFRSFEWKALLSEMRIAKQMHGALQPEWLLLNKLTPPFMRQIARKFLGKTTINPTWLNIQDLQAKDIPPWLDCAQHAFVSQSRLQLLKSSLPMLLHYEDRDSMAHSIESRTPFLDYRLVEFNLNLPTIYKLSGGWTKRILRDAMQDVMPKKICYRVDKMGFLTAEEHWVRQENPALFQHRLKESVELSQGILNENSIKILNEMIAGKRPYTYQVWRMIVFGLWMKQFSISRVNKVGIAR